jgi:hypothetical protein
MLRQVSGRNGRQHYRNSCRFAGVSLLATSKACFSLQQTCCCPTQHHPTRSFVPFRCSFLFPMAHSKPFRSRQPHTLSQAPRESTISVVLHLNTYSYITEQVPIYSVGVSTLAITSTWLEGLLILAPALHGIHTKCYTPLTAKTSQEITAYRTQKMSFYIVCTWVYKLCSYNSIPVTKINNKRFPGGGGGGALDPDIPKFSLNVVYRLKHNSECLRTAQ